MQKLSEIFVPSLLSTAVGLGIYKFVLGENLSESAPFLNMEIPAYAAVGGSIFAGAVTGEFLSDIVIPKIPKINALGSVQEFALPPLITGLSTYGSIYVLMSKNASLSNAILVGASANIGGKYAYDAFHKM